MGPQDHLGAKQRFLALLALREAEAWGAGDTDPALARIGQTAGIHRCPPNDLVARLVARIEAGAREPFYAAAARLTLAYAAEARSDLDLVEAGLETA